MRASNSANAPGQVVIHGRRVMGDTHLAYSCLKLQRKSGTLLYVPLQCVTKGVVIMQSLITKLSLIVHRPSKRPVTSVSVPLQFTTVVPLRMCGALRVPRRQRHLYRVSVLVVNNNSVSRRLRTQVRRLPVYICSACKVARALSRVTLQQLGKPSTSPCCAPFPSIGLSLSASSALVVSTPLIASRALIAGSITRLLPSNHFHVLKEGSGVVGDKNVGVRARVIRRVLHPVVPAGFTVASIPSPGFKRTVVLLVAAKGSRFPDGGATSSLVKRRSLSLPRGGLFSRLRRVVFKVLPGCRHPGRVLRVRSVPLANDKGVSQTTYQGLTVRECAKWVGSNVGCLMVGVRGRCVL